MTLQVEEATLEDGTVADCILIHYTDGVVPIPVEHVAVMAALLGEDLNAYDQVVELARTLLARPYRDAVEA